MKKLYLLSLAALVSVGVFAQVTVTYKVDITDYLAAGNTLGANGIRIGGNFQTTGTALAEWSPSDPTCAMTDEGDNVWSIAVVYPAESIGMEQQYKFVNNDWGTNEGTDPGNTIGADGCGSDDGAGNVNRLLTIPDADVAFQFCWDHCFRCDGSDPLLNVVSVTPDFLNLHIAPNPADNYTTFSYNVQNADYVTLEVYNMMGQRVATVASEMQSVGNHTVTINTEAFASGNYIFRLQIGNYATSGNIVKN
ncbi:MAG: T9SS type A sorting domain-containing protein [Chitinophagales bacterium]